MITISLNKKLDYQTYRNFCNFAAAGVDFGNKIKKTHPAINSKNYKQYIDQFYRKNQIVLLKKAELINQLLEKKQTVFWRKVKKLFGRRSIYKNYRGYLSIFDCNPRHIDKKTFQIFYKRNTKSMIGVVLHEALHFAFFDYCDRFLSEETREFKKNQGILWELSEIFNVIVLNSEEFQAILKRKEKNFYPALEKNFLRMRQLRIRSKKDVSEFVIKGLKTLSKNEKKD